MNTTLCVEAINAVIISKHRYIPLEKTKKQNGNTVQDRRMFFQSALFKIAEPISEFLNAPQQEFSQTENFLLRPPGSLPEQEFVKTCQRCNHCVEACPADAILPLQNTDTNLVGTPTINSNHQPCVVCDSLACMTVCPSGALQSVAVHEIRIGLAVVNHESCLNSQGINCRYCIEMCPIGGDAIQQDSQGKIKVFPEGCIGCGVCQYECPTNPKSIVVNPLTTIR